MLTRQTIERADELAELGHLDEWILLDQVRTWRELHASAHNADQEARDAALMRRLARTRRNNRAARAFPVAA